MAASSEEVKVHSSFAVTDAPQVALDPSAPQPVAVLANARISVEAVEGKWFIASANRPVPNEVVTMVRSMGGDTNALGAFQGSVKIRKEQKDEGEHDNPVYSLQYKLATGPESSIEFKGIGLIADDRLLVARGPGKTHALVKLSANEGNFVGTWAQPGKGLGLAVWTGREGDSQQQQAGLTGRWASVTLFEQKRLDKVLKERKKSAKKREQAAKPPKVQWFGSAVVERAQGVDNLYHVRFFEGQQGDAATSGEQELFSHVGTAIEYLPGQFALYWAKVVSNVVTAEQPTAASADNANDGDDDNDGDGELQAQTPEAGATTAAEQVVRKPEDQDICVYNLGAGDASSLAAQLATFPVDGFGSEQLVRAVARQLAHYPKELLLDVIKARNLRDRAAIGKSDPFVTVALVLADGTVAGDQKKSKWQTSVIDDNLNPVWNETVSIKLVDLAKSAGQERATLFEGTRGIRLTVKDKNTIRSDKFMGSVDLSWPDLDAAARISAPLFYSLAATAEHGDVGVTGELKLRVRFVGQDKVKLPKGDKKKKEKK
jgi:C2 domain